MLFYRILSFLVPLIIALLWSFLFWRANLTYLIFIISGLLTFLGSWWLVIKKVKSKKECFFYSFFSVLIVFSGLVSFLFIENLVLKIILVLLVIILFFLYLNQLFIQFFKKSLVKQERLWLFFRLALTLIIFLASSSLYGLKDFIGTSVILLLIFFIILVLILSWYSEWQKFDFRIRIFFFRILLAIIMGELFWAISLLPLIYYLKGVLLAIFYLVFNESIIWHFDKRYQPKLIRSYLIIVIILVLLILATAQWF